MNTEYTAVIKQEGDWWIGWIEEFPGVNCQDHSRDELIETLRTTLREALEFNREDAIISAGNTFRLERISKKRTSLYEKERVDQALSLECL